ncbi:MAG: peptide deformylase, partial [Candidatus Marisimplicoccus sp.]
MILPIIAYGDPILKQKASKFNSNELNNLGSLIDDLWETMYNAKGVGIAAPQIGVSKAIFVADFSFFEDEE